MADTSNSLDSSLDPNNINIQINNFDSYSAFPTVLDTKSSKSLVGLPFAQVPVVRFYGCLSTGHTVTIHCHGIFPYIFVKYDGSVTDSSNTMRERCSNVHKLMEKRLYEFYNKEESTAARKSLKYVANVSVIKGIPFYGYHEGYEAYYKISLLNASYVNKLSDLLRDGRIFTAKTDVYESHIPLMLQMMADYNLFGCGWMKLSRCYFRQPTLSTELGMHEILSTHSLQSFLKKHLKPSENVLNVDPFHRIGRTFLEIDILPQFIVNREDIEFRDLHHDFVELKTKQDRSDRRYVNSTTEIWKDIQNMRRVKGLVPYEVSQEIFRSSQLQYNWHADETLVKAFEEAVKRTSSKDSNTKVSAKDFFQPIPNINSIPCPREALAELWPSSPFRVNSKAPMWADVYPISSDDSSIRMKTDQPKAESTKIFSLLNVSTASSDTSSSTDKRKKTTADDVASDLSFPSNKQQKQNFHGIKRSQYTVISRPEISYFNIKEDFISAGLPAVHYSDPFYSNPLDCNKSQTEASGTVFHISSSHIAFRQPLAYSNLTPTLPKSDKVYARCRWKYIAQKPTFREVEDDEISFQKQFSVVAGKTPENRYGYKFKSNKINMKLGNSLNRMTHLTMELHVNSRGDKYPDPKHDAIRMIFWKIQDGTFPFDLDIAKEGVLIFGENQTQNRTWETIDSHFHITSYSEELEMIYALEDLIRFFDPDILSGYEIHSSSWGYLIDRCHTAHNYDVEEELSRVDSHQVFRKKDKWGYTHTSAFSITGRQVLNIWRPLRSGLNLLDYTLENVVFHVLHQRIPFFSYRSRTEFFNSNSNASRRCLLSYFFNKLRYNFELLETQNIIGKTIEQARLIGIDFHSVLYRGSQYKVESFLIRLCKSEHFILFSPSKGQVRAQKALESIPLVMEPSSGFYKAPLLVLDFQSLYPSILRAYNYCYSTMIGRVHTLKLHKNEIGVTKHDIPPDLLKLLSDKITVSPNGIVFVKEEVRQSVLAKMLKDILDTRFLIKSTMKRFDEEVELKTILNNRQEALKLLANVTYGYTSASFSGRMPCSDIADSIVQTGRETLERAIEVIESTAKWGAKIVYGDTDSLFVYLPGKSRKDAFAIGKEIATEITRQNPKPVELKFEKVYHPCFLVTKKRYVGYAYEHEDQEVPNFDAKGIETVRRDGTPAQQKIVEKALRIMFETTDLSKVKKYVQSEFDKIMTGKVNIQDFCFAREVKLGHYKSDKTAPPGAQIAMQRMEDDSRTEPQYKQRVPYVVKMGKMGETLTSRCLSPEAFLRSKTSRLDHTYYIVKNIIPPLQRFFQLVGVDVMDWYTSMSRTIKYLHDAVDMNQPNGNSLNTIVTAKSCLRCRKRVHPKYISRICTECRADKSNTTLFLQESIRLKQSKMRSVIKVCQTCSYQLHKDSEVPPDIIALKCQSKDCPVYFSKVKYINGLKDTEMRDLLLGVVDLDY